VARARRKHRPEPSLFPFLSILACVIGALALLITTQAVGQIATESIDVDHYEELEAQISEDRQMLAGLQALVEEVEALGSELDAEHKVRAALEEEVGSDAVAAAPLRQRLDQVGKRNSALERELALLTEGAQERASALDARREAQDAPLRVRPSGSGLGLVPQFIEARREGLRLYTSGGPVDVPALYIATNAEYRNFVRGAAQRRNATVIYLIRPGGVPNYQLAIKSLHGARFRTATMPIPGDGALDLSAFGPGDEAPQ
jgi:hypothetical protein